MLCSATGGTMVVVPLMGSPDTTVRFSVPWQGSTLGIAPRPNFKEIVCRVRLSIRYPTHEPG